jgi:predicted transcriptional regulator
MLENIQTLKHLGENVTWIRLDQFDFDLSNLRDADVITPTWDDFSAQTSTLVDLVYQCTHISGIGTGLDREFMKAVGDATLDGDLSVELVFEPAVVEAITEAPELARLFSDLTDAERATIHRYEGHDALMELGIHETKGDTEDVVMLCSEHDEGAPPGTLKTTNRSVWAWAESYFETPRAESHELRSAVFTP